MIFALTRSLSTVCVGTLTTLLIFVILSDRRSGHAASVPLCRLQVACGLLSSNTGGECVD